VQCFLNRPLSTDELVQLQSVHDLAGHLLPALPLAAQDLDASAFSLATIHQQMGRASYGARLRKGHPAPDLLTCYKHFADRPPSGFQQDSRSLLTAAEEWQLLGEFHDLHELPLALRQGRIKLLEAPRPPTFFGAPWAPGLTIKLAEVVKQCEAVLIGFIDEKATVEATAGLSYPLKCEQNALEGLADLATEMHDELKDSWVLHHEIAKPDGLKHGQQDFVMTITKYQVHIFNLRTHSPIAHSPISIAHCPVAHSPLAHS
jgi:hypothetical protein